MSIFQHTVCKPFSLIGIGVHSGHDVSVTIAPAFANTGIQFCRADTPDLLIEASIHSIVDARFCTVLGRKYDDNVMAISTVEHLLAALSAYGVDNAHITVSSDELPILDGSAKPYTDMLEDVGVTMQTAPRRFIRVLKDINVTSGDQWATLSPCDRFEIDFTVDFEGRVPFEKQTYHYIHSKEHFVDAVSPARTFSLLEDVERMRAGGFIKGGSLDNAVVLSGEGVLNPEGLRYDDECVRHKVLDAIGDLYLLGAPLKGKLTAYKPGHSLNHQIAHALLASPDAFCYETGEGLNPSERVAVQA